MVAQRTFEGPPTEEGEKHEWTVTRREARALRAELRAVRAVPEEVPPQWQPSPDEAHDALRTIRNGQVNEEIRDQRRTFLGALIAAALLHFVAGPVLLPSPYSEGDVLKRMAQNTIPATPVQVVLWTPPEEVIATPVAEIATVEPLAAVKQPPPPAKRAKPRRAAARKAKPTPKPERQTAVAGDAEVTPLVTNQGSPVVVAGSGEAMGEVDAKGDGAVEPSAIADPGPDLDKLFASYVNRVGRDVQRDFSYPRSLIRAGVEGTVVIEILVDDRGQIHGYKVAQSSGSRKLDRAALKAMKSISTVSAPPPGLGWATRSIRVPFVYRLKGSA